jgi:hypothetical protein
MILPEMTRFHEHGIIFITDFNRRRSGNGSEKCERIEDRYDELSSASDEFVDIH